MNIRDIFNQLNAEDRPRSPLLSKYYGPDFESTGYTANDPWGSDDPAQRPYQFNFERAPSAAPQISNMPLTLPGPGAPNPLIPDVIDTTGEDPASGAMPEAGPLGDYSDVGFGDIAKGALGIASMGLTGPIGAMATLGKLGSKAYDYFNPEDPYSSGIPEEVVDTGMGPQADPSALGGWGIDSTNLDNPNVSYDYGTGQHGVDNPDDYGYGLSGLQDAFSDPFGEGESDDDDDSCVVSTALAETGAWTPSEKRRAVSWCRRTHHNGSLRGRVWIDGYHQWGRVIAGLTRRSTVFKRLVKICSTAFVGQVTGQNKSVLGFVIRWGWATPLSYAIGFVRWMK